MVRAIRIKALLLPCAPPLVIVDRLIFGLVVVATTITTFTLFFFFLFDCLGLLSFLDDWQSFSSISRPPSQRRKCCYSSVPILPFLAWSSSPVACLRPPPALRISIRDLPFHQRSRLGLLALMSHSCHRMLMLSFLLLVSYSPHEADRPQVHRWKGAQVRAHHLDPSTPLF